MELTTLCYIEKDDAYLLLHRIKKQQDVNEGKWIGPGGHFEHGESPEECMLREVKEETGLTLTGWRFRGIVTFYLEDKDFCEYMCLYTADRFQGELIFCDEGVLEWVPKSEMFSLPLWEGDRIFLRLLMTDHPFFSLKLCYRGDILTKAYLDHRPLELFDIRDEQGRCTGQTRERQVAHEDGTIHGTSHVWILRPDGADFDLLLQKRSACKDAFPGCYDISSAGHIPAGDDFLPSALRELREELGITALPQELTFIGFRNSNWSGEFYGRPFRDHEISAVYVYTRPVEASALRLQKEEVESVCWQPFGAVREAVRSGDPLYCIYMDELDMLAGFWKKHSQTDRS